MARSNHARTTTGHEVADGAARERRDPLLWPHTGAVGRRQGKDHMSSTLYTIGTALSRAQDHGVVVRVLVGGQWIEGLVSAVDGHGVVLTGSGTGHHVVRVESISAVRVNADEPLSDQEPQYYANGDARHPALGHH